uniref:Uncharacterized protein n=1 Tax=Setaria viridis TaxID=4556 RepID=A0A4U6U7Z8_SETVI|nr:hypothetical protein SEVIR_6G130800v2 [Setaria viridis]
MGRNASASRGAEGSKRSSGKGKELQLPPPKHGKTNQTAPPTPACAWKKLTMKEEEIQALEMAKLLQNQATIVWRCACSNPWPLEEYPEETIFRVKPQPKLECTAVVGGTGIQMQEDSSSFYLEYELLESHSGCKEKWFYIEDHDPKLPKVTGHCLEWNNRWIDKPTHGNSLQVPELLGNSAQLKNQGLTGVRVAFSFMKRRCYEYSGLNDPSRMTTEEISDDRVMVSSDDIESTPWVFGQNLAVLGATEEEEQEEETKSSSSSDSDATRAYCVKVHASDKVGTSYGSLKCPTDDELETTLTPPPKKKRTVSRTSAPALAEGDTALAVETGTASLIAALMHDVIDSMTGIAVPTPKPTVLGALPMAIPMENPPLPVIVEVIPLNAAAPEASELEAARALEAMAATVGVTSEACMLSGREMVLVPSARIEPSIGIRVLPKEVQLIDDPLLDAQTMATILEMN